MIICLLIFLLYVSLYFITKHKKKTQLKEAFDSIGAFIWYLIKRLTKKNNIYKNKIATDLKYISSMKYKNIELDNFYSKKISKILLIIFIGNILIFFSFLSNLNSSNINFNTIEKNNAGEGTKTVEMIADSKDWDSDESFSINVKEKVYSNEEFDEIIEKNKETFINNINSRNPNLDHVNNNLTLSTNFLSYPFQVNWISKDPNIINSNGELLLENINEKGSECTIIANISYNNFEKNITIPLKVYLPEMTTKERDILEIQKEINNQNTNITNNAINLPANGKTSSIKWSSPKNNTPYLLFFLFVIGTILFSINENKKLHEKVIKRKEKLVNDYPEMLNKMSLLLGAGMTVNTAWERITEDNINSNKPLYNEMQFTLNEINSGIPTRIAYENFAKRCNSIEYTKFINMLTLNIQKGSSGLNQLLSNASHEAYENRQAFIKIRGEKVGTKLLLPMVMSLIVVLLIVIIPAILSINL